MADEHHWLRDAFAMVEDLRQKLSHTYDRAKSLEEKVTAMASVHDQIAAVFDDIEPKVAAIISSKGESDTANSDLLTRAQALQTSVDAAFSALTPAASTSVSSSTSSPASTTVSGAAAQPTT